MGFVLDAVCGRLLFAHGITREFDAFGVVDEAIEDGVGEGGVLELAVPEFDGELAGDEDAAALLPVFEEFEEQRLMAGAHGHEAEVVEDDQIDAREGFEPVADASLGLQGGEFFTEARQSEIAHRFLLIDDGFGECAGEITLADSGWADEEHVLVLLEPVEGDELLPAGFAEAARGA